MNRGGGGFLLLVLGLALALSVARVAGALPVLDGLERAGFDLRLRLRGAVTPPPRAVIVAIDEAAVGSIGTLGPMRAALAGALPVIAAAKPAVIAIDLLLATDTSADADLTRALSGAGPVVLAVAATRTPGPPPTPGQRDALARSGFSVVTGYGSATATPTGLIVPQEGLAAAALLGHVNIAESPDGVARSLPLALPVGGRVVLPALPLVVARHLLGLGRDQMAMQAGIGAVLGPRGIAAPDGTVTLNPYGGPGSVPVVPLGEVLAGRADPALFAGRAVFIGSTAETLRDSFATAFSPEVPGVEVLATAALNLAAGGLIERGAAAGLAGIALALGFAGLGVAVMRLPGWGGPVAGAVLVAGLSFAATGVALAVLVWVDAVAVTGATLMALGLAGLRRWRGERARSAQLSRERTNLARYVAPSVAAALAGSERPEFDGREQVCTVLFADVMGYTQQAEGMAPRAVADMLRTLHARFERAAEAQGAAVVDYLGDGVMVVFGLPDPAPGDAAAAIACARALLVGEGDPAALRLRVSLHSGPVAVAVLGGARQGHLTVTGDTVNVAARLQDVAKAEGVGLVVSEAVLEAAGADRTGWRFLRADPLRGRTREISVWTPAG